MRKITVETEAPKIEINGIEFQYRMGDGEISWMGRDVLAKCVTLNVDDHAAVADAIGMVCSMIDDVLGHVSMEKIMQGRPVSMNAALKVLNGILADCNSRYAAYIRREYTGGRKNAKIQPVRA